MPTPPTTELGFGHPRTYTNYSQKSIASPDELEETADIAWPTSVMVYERMRRQDAQVKAVLRAVTLPIRRTQWRIDPAGAKKRVTKLLAEDLGLPILGDDTSKPPPRTRDRFSWPEHLRLALLKLTFGHAFFEQVYRPEGGMLRLRKLAYRLPTTISGFDIANDGGLNAIYQQGQIGDRYDIRIGIERLVAYVEEREGGNWVGQSLLRTAYGPWVLKQKAMRTNAISMDRNANGVPIYTAAKPPEGLTNADEIRDWIEKDMEAGTLLAQAYRGGENAGSAIPPDSKLEFPGPTGRAPDVAGWIEQLNGEIGRSVLAHFLGLASGDQTGSYALGETFESFFTLSLQTIAMDIADVATQHIVEDWIDWNFGPDEPAPRIIHDEIGSRHPATAEAIMALVQCGALMPDDKLESYLRNQYGLPIIDLATRRVKADPKGPTDANQQDGQQTDQTPPADQSTSDAPAQKQESDQ